MAGASFWLLFAPREKPRDASHVSADAEDMPAYLKHKYGTLTVRVQGPGGGRVPLAEVGYERPPKTMLYGTQDDGTRTLNDVPLGEITVVVQAPGFQTVRRPVRIEAGVPEELTVILTPLPDGATR